MDYLVAHGGLDMPSNPETLQAIEDACVAGIKQSGSATDRVVAALETFENDPLFNAGYGSVLNHVGGVETDALIFDGRSGRIAGVGSVPKLRHPSRVAAALLTERDFLLLCGSGARKFADKIGEPQEDLRTHEQIRAWRSYLYGANVNALTGHKKGSASETVGAIAVFEGVISAGTSTGGLLGKPEGRVGDSAVYGAGLWSDARFAVVCSGVGEAMMKVQLASRVGHEVNRHLQIQEAVEWGVSTCARETNGACAVLAMDRLYGSIGAAHNGTDFPVGLYSEAGFHQVHPVKL